MEAYSFSRKTISQQKLGSGYTSISHNVQISSGTADVPAVQDSEGFVAYFHPDINRVVVNDFEGNEAFSSSRGPVKLEDGHGNICYTRSGAALREFKCDDPLSNFLLLYQSGHEDFSEDDLAINFLGFNFKEASNRGELYTAHQILEAMQLVTDKSLDEYLGVITHSISDIRFKYKDFTEEDIDESLVLEKHKKSFIEERYNFMKHLVTQYKKSECYSDKCSNDVLKEKLKVWCNEAYQLQETTTRTSSITLKEEL